MRPASGETFRAVGRVIRAGRTLTVCGAEVEARQGEKQAVIAVMQGTMMTVDTAGLED